MRKKIKIWMMATLMTGCGLGVGDDGAAGEAAVAWADAYFNCDFHQAEEYATEESDKWLRFAASNTTEADLELLREHPAEVEMQEYYTIANDTLRVVTLTVTNALAATAPDEDPRQDEKDTILVTVVKRDGDWKVRMEGLPRSEKQSRD